MMGWDENGWHMSGGTGFAAVMLVLMTLQVLLLAGVVVLLIGDRAQRSSDTYPSRRAGRSAERIDS